MDPLITNGIDPVLLRVLEKRGHERDGASPRKRPATPAKPEEVEGMDGENSGEDARDDKDGTPKHALDDLA
ncbi:MAG: hypothetical protein WBW53_09230 [Terriglobales bacterium]